MRKQTIRSIAAIFACVIVSASMVTTAFAEETTTTAVADTTTVATETTTVADVAETTTAVETTVDAEITTAPAETTEVAETTTVTDAPIVQEGVEISGNSMYNNCLKLVVANNGLYTLGTTNGDPLSSTDNDKTMIYGFPSTSSTSFSTIVVDGVAKMYQANNGAFDAENKAHVSSMAIGNLVAVQTLRFVANESTGREDVLEMRLDVRNNDTVAHNVGGRIMIDTMLGSNDRAPFRVPGTGDVTTETEYVGADVPAYWQAFDSLSNPSIIAQGSFRRNNSNPPSLVQFVNWGDVSDDLWGYQVTPGRSNGDSAVTAVWNEGVLQPGQTVTFKTCYGLSELTQDLNPPLTLSVSSDSTVNLNITEELAEVLFTSYVENIGDEDAENVYVRIELPNGWSLAENSEERIGLDTLSVEQLRQSSWTIQIPTDFALGTYPVTVYVGADDIEEKGVTRYITLVNEDPEDDSWIPIPGTTTTAPVNPAPSTTRPAGGTSTAPKTGDAGVCGLAAALAASVAASFAMKRKKNQ